MSSGLKTYFVKVTAFSRLDICQFATWIEFTELIYYIKNTVTTNHNTIINCFTLWSKFVIPRGMRFGLILLNVLLNVFSEIIKFALAK